MLRFNLYSALFIIGCLLVSCTSETEKINPDDISSWFPFHPDSVHEQGAIGMSDWLDAPAGKHGFVKVSGDELRFEDGTPVKFWGVNICSKQPFSEHDRVDHWVKFLSKYGINGVRFHKFTWYAYKGDSSTVFAPEKWEKFDYFNHKLREEGIYYGWSHIYGHRPQPADSARLLAYEEISNLEFPWSHLNSATTGLINFAPDLQELNIELTVNMLNHVNPHTGLRYADDPALSFIEFQNEDNIFWGAIEHSLEQAPTYRKLLNKLFSEWLLEKYGSEDDLVKAWGQEAIPDGESLEMKNIYPNPNHGYFQGEYEAAIRENRLMARHILDKMRFLYEQQLNFYEKFEKAIRDTGYKGPLVGSCWQAGSGIAHYYNLYTDAEMGIVDRHNYFGGDTGHRLDTGKVNNQAMVDQPGSGLLSTGLQQVSDKPFALSEWISRIPNEWVAEANPIIALYGLGLQGWDASYEFAVDHTMFTNTIHTPGVYNATSPTQMGLFPALARAVYRGDVQQARNIAVRNVHIPSLENGQLGFSETVKQDYDAKSFTGVVPKEALAAGRVVVDFTDGFESTESPDLQGLIDSVGMVINTPQEQLKWDYDSTGCIMVNTPGTKGLIGFGSDKVMSLEEVEFSVQTPFAVVLITSLEQDKGLLESKRWLITTIARARNTGMAYNEDKTKVLAVGEAPILLEPVMVSLKIKETDPGKGKPIVHILDHGGMPTGNKVEADEGFFQLNGAVTKAIYYEVSFE